MNRYLVATRSKRYLSSTILVGLLVALFVIYHSQNMSLHAQTSRENEAGVAPFQDAEWPEIASTESRLSPSSLTLNFPMISDGSASGAMTNTLFIPVVSRQVQLSTRLGYGDYHKGINYPDVDSLRAGWYLDWQVQVAPERPNNMKFVQVIRLHQKLACPLGSAYAWDRTVCPYEDDYVLVDTSTEQIIVAAAANPGSLWLIGNEMERRDFRVCFDWPVCSNVVTHGQDEILPEKYAEAYYDLYQLIKGVDPKAQIAIGGVIQPTPLRLEYLSRIWNAYQLKYGVEMPVDVWNVHAFVLREERGGYGADIPAGLDATTGVYTESDCTHLSKDTFDQQMRAMRQWMKDRGQQNKPLMVSEYSPLYRQIYTGNCDSSLDPADRQVVIDYMTWTFDYFLNTKDTDIGYPADDHRLVQMWNWFSLSHVTIDADGNVLEAPLNEWASLFNRFDTSLTDTGRAFRQFSLSNMAALSQIPSGISFQR